MSTLVRDHIYNICIRFVLFTQCLTELGRVYSFPTQTIAHFPLFNANKIRWSYELFVQWF